jgi:hypothetical protein
MATTHITNIKGRFVVDTSHPADPKVGFMYFNTSNNSLMYWTGNNWIGFAFS